MILQYRSFAIAKTFCDPLAFFPVKHNAAELRVDRMVFVKAQTVLRDHVEFSTEDRKSLTIHAGSRVSICSFVKTSVSTSHRLTCVHDKQHEHPVGPCEFLSELQMPPH